MKKIAWITGSNFFNVDEPLMRQLNKFYNIYWVVFIQKNEKEKEYLHKQFVATGLKGEILILGRLRSLKTLLIYFKTIYKLKKWSPDLFYIDCLGMPFLFPIIRIAGLQRRKLMYACHDFVDHLNIKRRGMISLYKKFIFKTVLNVKFFSLTQRRLFESQYQGYRTFYSPLCLQYYGEPQRKKINDGKIHFLFFGSIRENKGLDILISAVNILNRKLPGRFMVSICGYSDNWGIYEKLIEDPNCFNLRIERIRNNEIPDLFSIADYLVLPYRDVTQSGPLSIAYSYNLPVIASNHDGFKEFIKDNETGLLFADGDANDLSNIMEKAVLNLVEYEKLKEAQRKFISTYLSMNVIVSEYDQMFHELLCD